MPIACCPQNQPIWRTWSLTRARIVCLASVLILCADQDAAPDSPWLYGIHWFGSTSNNADVSAMTGGKPVWVLETVMTNDGYGQWGPEGQLSRFQNEVDQGHTLIIRVQPVWGKAFPLPEDTNPSMAAFLDQVTHTATLYQDICHIWHLGNEMNLDFEWGGRHLLPEDYIEGAVQFADRIHAVASSLGPQIVLVGPAGPGDEVGDPKWMGCTEYLSRMCDAINDRGYRDRFDGFAMHAYGFHWYTDVNSILYDFEERPGWGYQYQTGILDNKGFQNYPVYITEWNRYTGVPNGAEEYASAQFLHRAFLGIHNWNQVGHPITAACWYIYHDWGGWAEYSLRTLKNDDTRDHDVWHAFQYACTQNYPAGYPVTGPTPTPTPPTGEPGPNLLSNWSFEGSGSGGLDGWTVQPNFILDNTYPSGDPPPDGSHWAGHSYTGGSPSIKLAYQAATVVPGHRYLLRVQVMGGGAPGGISTGRLQWYNGDFPGAGAGQNVAVFSWPQDEPAMIWREMSGIVVPTSNRLTYMLQVEIAGNGIGAGINFDACELRDVEPSPTPTPKSAPHFHVR